MKFKSDRLIGRLVVGGGAIVFAFLFLWARYGSRDFFVERVNEWFMPKLRYMFYKIQGYRWDIVGLRYELRNKCIWNGYCIVKYETFDRYFNKTQSSYVARWWGSNSMVSWSEYVDFDTFDLITWEVSSSTQDYVKDKFGVYITKQIDDKALPRTWRYYYLKKIIGADPRTFEIISARVPEMIYAKDKNLVYYNWTTLSWADPQTFVVSTGSPYVFAKDKEFVFLWYTQLSGANPQTFKFISGWYSTDGTYVWFGDKARPIYGVDINSFQAKEQEYAEDKNFLYFWIARSPKSTRYRLQNSPTLLLKDRGCWETDEWFFSISMSGAQKTRLFCKMNHYSSGLQMLDLGGGYVLVFSAKQTGVPYDWDPMSARFFIQNADWEKTNLVTIDLSYNMNPLVFYWKTKTLGVLEFGWRSDESFESITRKIYFNVDSGKVTLD